MKDPSKTYCQATSNPSPSATSSPESASGPMPSDKPDGPTIEKSGPEVVPANLSAQQAREQGLLTSGTYGPRFITSSGSVRLEQSLVSKLQAKTALLGSGLFRLTWKQRDTPSGVSIFALRASGRRTSDKDCTSWLTPNTPSGGPNVKPSAKHTGGMDLEGAATLAPWSTPRANKWGFPDAHGSDERPMAGWPTNNTGLEGRQRVPECSVEQLTGPSGLVNGFWKDAEWIFCRDQKFRPIEPGSSPLAAGITGRVGKLRGYGNALTAPVAQGFIEAYLEVTQHA